MEGLFSTLLSWFLALCTWTPLGQWLLNKLDPNITSRPIHQFILATLIGAALNSAVLGFLSFWIPITAMVSVVIAALTLFVFVKPMVDLLRSVSRSVKSWSISEWIGFGVVLCVGVVCSLKPSLHNDSGLYYNQFIKWIGSYPVVPGLGNLHYRLGFNSHWHLLSAAFDMKSIGLSSTDDLNGLIFVLIGLGAFDSVSRISNLDLFDLIWALSILPLFWLLRFLTSTTPDVASALIPFVYFAYFWDKKSKASLPVLALLICFAATIKVLSILHGIILIPIIYRAIRQQNWSALLITSAFVSIVLVPWFARNVVQTGYLIFPLESIDLFSVEWKVPAQLSAHVRELVEAHAKFGSYDVKDIGRPSIDWVGSWLSVQSKGVMMMLVVVMISAILIFFGELVRLVRSKFNNGSAETVFLSFMVLVSLAFWWKSGPNPRFVYGVLFFFLATSIALGFSELKLGKWLRYAPFLGLVSLIMVTPTVLFESGPKRPVEFSVMTGKSSDIYYPTTTDKCWDHELPCADMDRPALQFRGSSMEQGFVTK